MTEPTNLQEFECVLRRLATSGKFSFKIDGEMDLMPDEMVLQAIQEVVSAIQAARDHGTTPSACERLMGSLFVSAVEHCSRNESSTLVTISEADSW